MIVRCPLDNSFHPYPYKICKLNALYFKYAKTMLRIYCLYGRRMTKLSKNAHEPGGRAPRFWPVGREQKSRRSSLLTVISRHGRERTRTFGRKGGYSRAAATASATTAADGGGRIFCVRARRKTDLSSVTGAVAAMLTQLPLLPRSSL